MTDVSSVDVDSLVSSTLSELGLPPEGEDSEPGGDGDSRGLEIGSGDGEEAGEPRADVVGNEPEHGTTPAEDESEPTRKQFLRLAANERKMREQIEKEKQGIQAKEQQIQEKASLIESLTKGNYKEKLKALDALGVNFTEFVQDVATDGSVTPERAQQQLINKVARLEQELVNERQAREQASLRQTADQYIGEFSNILADEKYEAVRDFYEFIGAAPTDELGTIYSHYEDQGQHLTAQQMADIMLEEAEKRWTNSNKFKRVSASTPTQAKTNAPKASMGDAIKEELETEDDMPEEFDDLPLRDRERMVMNQLFRQK